MLDEISKQCIQRHIQKLTNATQQSFAERALLQEHNRFLTEINNEANLADQPSRKELGEARIMSYGDLEKAQVEQAAKEAAEKARKTEGLRRLRKRQSKPPRARVHVDKSVRVLQQRQIHQS